MVTFDQARRKVEALPPGYDTATYGFETDREWFVVTIPERTGGRVPAVDKASGRLRWIEAYSDDYSQERMVGARP